MATDPLYLWGDGGVAAAIAVGINLFNLAAGYLAMAMLAGRTLARRGRSAEAVGLILLPFYWLLDVGRRIPGDRPVDHAAVPLGQDAPCTAKADRPAAAARLPPPRTDRTAPAVND